MKNKLLFVITNDHMLNFMNKIVNDGMLNNDYLILVGDKFKNRLNAKLQNVICGSPKSTLFNIIDDTNVDWTVIGIMYSNAYENVLEAVNMTSVKESYLYCIE